MDASVYDIRDPASLPTPSLLLFPSVLHANIDRMASLVGDLGRLRPHIKTHKCRQVVRLLMERGIRKFKCASVDEVRLLIESGSTDIMLAYPMVGPNARRLAALLAEFPQSNVIVTADDAQAAAELNEACRNLARPVDVLIDLDVGMHRTGIAPDQTAEFLAQAILRLSHLRLRGLHAYDGHIRDNDLPTRQRNVQAAMSEALRIKDRWTAQGLCDGPVFLSTSGSLSFIAAKDIDGIDELTPGTWLFWDGAYDEIDGHRFDFAALVASRVISRPTPDTVSLDAGSKGISRDVPGQPLVMNRPGLIPERASEEHQVCRWTGQGPEPRLGEMVLFAPRHVCTTIYLYSHFSVCEGGRVIDHWPILCRHGNPNPSSAIV